MVNYDYYGFLFEYLLQNPLFSYATGSAQPQITIDNIKDVLVPYPEIEDIKNILEQINTINEMIYQNILENDCLEKTRDTLLPKLMSGEIDVTDLSI